MLEEPKDMHGEDTPGTHPLEIGLDLLLVDEAQKIIGNKKSQFAN